MSIDKKINIVVAETSPIISAGILHCLHRLPGLQIQPIEVCSYANLIDAIRTYNPPLIIVNPYFTGTFNPNQLKNDISAEFKTIAIEVGVMDRQSRSLYDQTISIVEDLHSIASKIKDTLQTNLDKEKESLSLREKEIITLVVKGLTNKEIADKLYLSVHTVITHRRNSARKLEIHSATGLTIYAIVNHLVDLSEIKL